MPERSKLVAAALRAMDDVRDSYTLQRSGDSMNEKARVSEIAHDLFALSIYVPAFNLRFNHFLIKDEEPLLFHAGMKQMFPLLRDAVARVIDPSSIRWVSFSHYEADECGALNEWLQVAPRAEPVCGLVGAAVSVNDLAVRPARVLAQDEVLKIGRHRLRFRQTPHVPHNWEASLLFEEVTRTLFCSDLFTHNGDVAPLTDSDVVDRAKQGLIEGQQGTLRECLPLHAVDGSDPPWTGRFAAGAVGAHAWLRLRGRRGTSATRSGDGHARRAGIDPCESLTAAGS